MSTFKFYALDGKEIGKEAFIKSYSESYYIGGPQVKKVSQSSPFIEKEIESLLKKGIQKDIDVIHILAWKIGKIKHAESLEKFTYASDWSNAESLDVTRYGNPFEIKPLVQYITGNISTLEKLAETAPQEVLEQLKEHAPAGIGTVYLITMLYFISKGKYPIYDKYAKMALYAILNNVKPGEMVCYTNLPEKTSPSFSHIMSQEMQEYVDEIEQIFGKEYLDSRNIDRALWVYGHQFDLSPSSDSSDEC